MNEPDNSDCPYRGTNKQSECADAGCGFCAAARQLCRTKWQKLRGDSFSDLRQFRQGIETGPIDLRDALDAAFRQIDGDIPGPSADQLAILGEYTGSWFGHAVEVRLLLQTLGCPAGTFGVPKAQS